MESPDPLIGVRLGDYQVVERIGEGGMGIVYRGFQPLIRKRVAIKVIKPEIAGNPENARRLLAEAQSVNAIGHRGIIDIFGFGQVPDGRHYLVMEYLEGQSLDQQIRDRGAFFPLEAIPLLKEICGALSAAHAQGIIHRDLKPSNVFVVAQPDGERFIKLLDFGLAKQGEAGAGVPTPQTSDMHIVGTPEYMAPEQARAEPVSPRTDLYALGVLAFELLTGQMPFKAGTPIELVMQHLETPAPAPSSLVEELPRRLDALVLRLMEKDPALRPASADAVRAELVDLERELVNASTRVVRSGEKQSVGSQKTVNDTTIPSGELASRRRRRLLLAGAVGGGALVLALAAVAMKRTSSPPAPVAIAPAPAPPREAPPPPAPAPPVPVQALPPAPAPSPQHPPPRPAKDDAPSADDLRARLDRLQRKMEARGDDADPTALALLRKQRLELTVARTPSARRKIEQYLDVWERQYSRR